MGIPLILLFIITNFSATGHIALSQRFRLVTTRRRGDAVSNALALRLKKQEP